MARRNETALDTGLLALRLVSGGLMAGHGAQKLWGAFGGYGLAGTSGWLESLGLKPGKNWAMLAGGGEFVSGVLTALGLLGPVGPLTMIGPMGTAWGLAHGGKPIWVSSGGAELPLTNLGIVAMLALAGPGRYSLDELLGIEVPTAVGTLATVAAIGGVVITMVSREVAPPAEPAAPAGNE